ncbi:glutamine amidotransferase isoform A [Micractinium conductrix]|uniref:Glutamine amidotransferase isoform A n=1 Tax=Micractinium conductrix TaxID=554055 RepID=A0A2P6V542_9CHLO|nr:glutamine amidotransferase isoform B [Micractinium conductrix]PSC69200.1 glutamine amidotransferase isoform A [Micractinium conductrix]|eukprot:PSC69199.1 glutamine amidotransferase isoform B [Micractinium conductrix]
MQAPPGMPGAQPAAAAVTSGRASEPLGDQLFVPTAIKNNFDVMNFNKIFVSLLAGCFAGITGITGYRGFIVYLLAHVAMGALLWLKAGGAPQRYFPSSSTPLLSGILAQTELLTFILFWTLSNNMAPPAMAAAENGTARHYGILIAGEPDKRCCESKGTFAQMFLDLLRDEGCGEEWRLYFAFQGQLPSEEELRELKGVVITGSVADAFGNDEWLVGLRACIKQAMQLEKRVLGVCFGHQLVGVTLGAKVGRAGCWEVGAREVEVSAAGRTAAAAAACGGWTEQLPDRLCLHEFHQDQVLEVPPGATLLASSERCPVEMFSVGGHVLCIQGHPEFDSDVVRLLAEPRLGLIGEADVARMHATLAQLPAQRDAPRLQQLCKAFLKG